MSTFKRVSHKATKWTEAKESKFEVAVKNGKSVEVKCDGIEETKTFAIGETVFWKYAVTALTGEIDRITANSVFVKPHYATRAVRFTLAEFAEQNFSFCVGKAHADAHDYAMYS